MRQLFIIPVLTLAVKSFAITDPAMIDPREAIRGLTEEPLKAHLSFLASDALEGRETSYRGQKIAARYIASIFESAGLMPIGTNKSYYQTFPVRHLTVNRKSSIVLTDGAQTEQCTTLGTEYFPSIIASDTTMSGEVEFVGYGICAPALDYCDYDTTRSYKGKIVIALAGLPRKKDSTSLFTKTKISSSSYAKRAYASIHGAAALLIVEDLDEKEYAITEKERLDQLNRGTIVRAEPYRWDLPVIWIRSSLANRILQRSGYTVQQLSQRIDSTLNPMSLPFPSVHVALNIYVNREEKIVENVIGMIPGSDSTLRNEYLVITSHYDHLGKHSITQEIFHGADDDASGTSALLEIAQGMAAQNVRPKRSVIFLAATGEEKGLLGSIYYTRHPLIPLGETVANLNIDMVGRIDPSHDDRDSNYIYIIGSDRLSTDLHKLNELANKESANLNLDYRYNDKTDSNKFYERSDHYNFAKRGVPIIFYFNGVHEDYHMPSDRSEKILYPLLLRRTQLIYWTGWKIATAPKRPAVDIDADFTTPLPTP